MSDKSSPISNGESRGYGASVPTTPGEQELSVADPTTPSGTVDQILFNKWPRLEYFKPTVAIDIEKMFVPTENQLTATGQGAGDKLVIVRARTDGLNKWLRLAHLGLDDHQFQQPCDVYPMVLLMQDLSDPPVFFQEAVGLSGPKRKFGCFSPDFGSFESA
ncbi:hypothetical protein [Geoalkalibacter halelectricus]|uniref:hypothetical protein n=1 Tax=Geoalkalibacter halelectricus TaxID=2847045 RepID=UPI00266EE586|nr:hypothetical protein [Geoalkalibacter halelectricus]MDO3379467.1 hypothetical protein [Geoalkalibacter halelectricus]